MSSQPRRAPHPDPEDTQSSGRVLQIRSKESPSPLAVEGQDRRNLSEFARRIVAHYRKPRVLGLDLLRIVAATSIVVFHGNATKAFGRNVFSAVIGSDGYLAVDIFFVLSGWLLTRQVLRMSSSFPTWRGFATRFWTRRWARTLPPYWLVLIALFLFGTGRLPHYLLPEPLTFPALIKHAFFLQTALPPNLYNLSWSLVTEEWFYLLLPAVVILALKVRSPRVLIALAIVGLLVPMAVRALLLTTTTLAWWEVAVLPQARFDGLVVGALLAAASTYAPWWDKVMAHRGRLFVLGLALSCAVLAAGVSNSRLYVIVGLLAFSVSLGLLMPFLSRLHWSAATPGLVVIGITYLSELTYPLYLVHPLVQVHWTRLTGEARLGQAILGLVILFASATVLHLGVERPFLALRDRWDRRRWKEPAAAEPPATIDAVQPSVALALPVLPDAALSPQNAG